MNRDSSRVGAGHTHHQPHSEEGRTLSLAAQGGLSAQQQHDGRTTSQPLTATRALACTEVLLLPM